MTAGAKLVGGLRGMLLDPFTLAVSSPAITNVAALRRPWAQLEECLRDVGLEEHTWGTAYLAWAAKPAQARTSER